jgi:hypothetical protein
MTLPRGTSDDTVGAVGLSDLSGGPMAEEWITKAQAAAILGVDERTIERRARAGRIASRGRPGFPTSYLAADVEKLRLATPGEVRTGVLEAGQAVPSNGNGAIASLRGRTPSYEEAIVELVQTVQRALTQAATGPTGPTIAPTGPTAAYVPKTEALAIAGVSDDELRKAVAAGEVKIRGRRYRRVDLEAL